ncbi:MAG: nucleoside monophosphate kinase [Bacilli bacterium]
MNLVFISPPAAGKGTISDMLKQKYDLTNISVGQLLRDVDSSTPVGMKIREIQQTGQLVDLSITVSLLEKRLEQPDIKKGFILDGFPRNLEQALELNELLNKIGVSLDHAVYLKVDEETAKKRILGRLVCPNCKATFNNLTGFNTPIKEGVCNICSSSLESRNDDNEESFKKRFNLFNKETYPVVDYYKKLGKLIEVDASLGKPEETLKELERKLGL